MNRRTKFSLVAIVLVAGVGLAWQFRKHGEAEQSATLPGRFGPTDSFAATAPKAAVTGQDNPALSPSARLVGASAAAAESAVPSAESAAGAKRKFGDNSPVPELSSAFPGVAGREARSDPIGGIPRLDGLSDLQPGPTHRVTDGDTLTQLAERYLGSADRWRELYEFNRDVLATPELLPIGAELRIPTTPFRPAAPAPPSSAAAAAGPPALSKQATARPVSQSLAPAAESPASSEANLAPAQGGSSGTAGDRAEAGKQQPPLKTQPLPPVAPVGRVLRVAPRTYVVQSGDTLNSIAERLYGDGAKESILREANRNLVASPRGLRAGMVLIIPLEAQ